MKKFISFQTGILLGTLVGSIVSTFVCVLSFDAMGYKLENFEMIQKCLLNELEETRDVRQ